VLELGNRRGNLQTEVEDLLLALKTDVRGPSDHAAEVALGLDVLADAIVLGALLDERVLPMVRACEINAKEFSTYLGGLLVTSLALGEGGRRGFLSRLGRHLVL
jgi:hypothetical protein